MELLNQLGEFFLQSVPTIILVFLFYWFLKANLFQPLSKVMAERSAQIEGARKESEASQAAAQDKVRAAKEVIAKDFATARVQLEQESQALGAEIVRTILERRPPSSPVARSAQ